MKKKRAGERSNNRNVSGETRPYLSLLELLLKKERLVVLVGLREEHLGGELGEDDGAQGLAGLRDEAGLQGQLGEHGSLLTERHLQREKNIIHLLHNRHTDHVQVPAGLVI